MNIGSLLRDIRKDNNKKLRQVSEGTSLSISYLSDIERGRTNPSLKTLQKIIEFFDDGRRNTADCITISPDGIRRATYIKRGPK